MVRVFFRNDDVIGADKKFILLNKIFTERKIPVHHEVIPKDLSLKSAKELIKIHDSGLIEYGQHGYSHKKHGKMESEFLGRTYEQQEKDIRKGKEIMEQMMTGHYVPVFSPPFHTYNEDTLRAVNKLGFRIFSANRETKYDMKIYNFSFIPVSIAFNVYDSNSKRFITDIKALIKKFASLKDSMPLIGIYMHHKFCNAQDFKNLIIFIKYLIKEKAEFCRLSESDKE